jgi:glycogen phosphorylase
VYAGDTDIDRAVAALAERLPDALRPLAGVAYDLSWSWTAGGDAVFASIDPDRWERLNHNPVQLLTKVTPQELRASAGDSMLVDRVATLVARMDADRARPDRPGPLSSEEPVAFMCAEFGVHASLPIYSGGLGVLAGDIVKEASDLALPMVGVGLLYRTGYFHQRIDTAGMQHEYWTEADPTDLACVLVTDGSGAPLAVTIPVDDEDVVVHVWRADVGRVPLYLLDTDVPANSTRGRWITSRLYEGNREIRLAQYAVLGLAGARALEAMGVAPSVFHLNEGHPALAAVDVAPDRMVFTTHTPVPAGNETYSRDQVLDVLGRIAEATNDVEGFLRAGRIDEANTDDPFGMTVLALRRTRSANAVSRRHGEVARDMWQPVFDRGADDVPITHVTNGVHVPTWMAPPMRELLDRHLPEGWLARADDPDVWAPVDGIPDEELWGARNVMRAGAVAMARHRATQDRLRRGEESGYARAAERGLHPEHLTIGFARRLALYKRLYLVSQRAERAVGLVEHEAGVQFLIAGKAHPLDEEAKGILLDLFALKYHPDIAGRVVYLEDYDLSYAADLVAGCDVWVNVPRPPQEASGTSGMKAALNGAINLSVLDGWWAEAYDGANGWAIDGEEDSDVKAQDERHADALFDLLENEVIPMFHERDDTGVPRRWVAMMKRSIRSNGPRFSATRMVKEYAERIYPPAGN